MLVYIRAFTACDACEDGPTTVTKIEKMQIPQIYKIHALKNYAPTLVKTAIKGFMSACVISPTPSLMALIVILTL